MNIRVAKKIIKNTKDLNELPFKILRAKNSGIQKLLNSNDTRFGVVEFDKFGIDLYYELTKEDREKSKEHYTLYTRKWESDGEPELDWFEHGLWDTEFGLTDDKDYYHTGGGQSLIISSMKGLYRRNMLEKEYLWLCENSKKYVEVYPGISILKEDEQIQ